MNKKELTIPKLGESVHSVQLIRYLKKIGDHVETDEILAEVTTDKVDAEIPSKYSGRIVELRFNEGDKMQVGDTFAVIDLFDEILVKEEDSKAKPSSPFPKVPSQPKGRFLSPLVKRIAKEEGLGQEELKKISGSGHDGRISKNDVLKYLQNRVEKQIKPNRTYSGQTDIIEMDNMRKIIAQRMKQSKQTSPHVTAFVEADVTDMMKWREANKDIFLNKYGYKLTVTPLLVEAVAKVIQDYPMINSSVDETETKILNHHDINIGLAAELPNGNLIVPVIKQADQYDLANLSRVINEKVQNARNSKLSLEDVQGGTFTISNVGTFGNVMGTPIINQPEVAILATGVIKKKPAVLETPAGDVFAVRQFMFLSLSFDHRIVDGSLGGRFLKGVADYLENWNLHKTI